MNFEFCVVKTIKGANWGGRFNYIRYLPRICQLMMSPQTALAMWYGIDLDRHTLALRSSVKID